MGNVDMSTIINDIVRRYSINLNEIGSDGMTPLIVAIDERKVSYIRTILSINNCTERIQRCTLNKISYKNCLPLHIVLHEGISWKEGLKEILENNLEAVSEIDTQSRLYPFMIAAATQIQLDGIYRILQISPGIVENCVVSNDSCYQKRFICQRMYHHFIFGVLISFVAYVVKILYVYK